MSTQQEIPVLICGAGPVGLGLALALKRCGVDSIVIEKKPALDLHSRALGITPRTLEVFHAWNCLEPFLESGELLKNPQIWLVGRDAPVAKIDLSALKKFTEFPELLVLPQDQTERLLLEQVVAAQGDVRFGHELLNFSQDENGVTALIKNSDGEYFVRAQFLAGCDGAHSRVRQVLGWKLRGKTYRARVMICDIELHDERDDLPWPRATQYRDQPLIALRYAAHRWRIIHPLDENQTDQNALSAEYIGAIVEQLFGAGEFENIWSSSFRIHCRHSARWVKNRVMLCSDAAHLNSPAGGQGMNSGLHDAHNLAWKLAAILKDNADARVLLESYQSERKGEVLHGVERYTDLLTRTVLLAPPAQRNFFLLLAKLILSVAPLRRKLLKRAAMLDTRYRRSPILRRTSTLVGARAPDGAIYRGQQTRRLLDCVFPHALLILFDDGKLPRWNENEIRASVENIAPTNVQVLRLTNRDVKDETAWRDANGDIFRAWKIGTATAALIRPDGHIGYFHARPKSNELLSGIRWALD